MNNKTIQIEDIRNNAEAVAEHIEKNRKAIHYILRKFESYDVVEDEINKSIETLKNITDLEKYFTNRVNLISTFLPLNMPLYSFVLFAVIPSYQALSLIVRVPTVLGDNFTELFKLLLSTNLMENISLYEGKRKEFVDEYCLNSDVIIFTGKYQNFSDIRYRCKKETLMLFSGSGHNPVVVTETADLDLAVQKIIEAKLYNNGQDCIAPNIIFVHTKIILKFIDLLTQELDKMKVDINYSDDNTKIGPLMDRDSLVTFCEMVTKFLEKGAKIIYGGKIDFKYNLAYPSVFLSSIQEIKNYQELYSPIIVVDEYAEDKDLELYFDDSNGAYKEKQMYVSVFGHSEYAENIKGSIILKNKSAVDAEEGNNEFGGYSLESSAISYMGESIAKPILIPREIYEYLFKTDKD